MFILASQQRDSFIYMFIYIHIYMSVFKYMSILNIYVYIWLPQWFSW